MDPSPPDVAPADGKPREARSTASVVASLARFLAEAANAPDGRALLSTGEHAALRRMDPQHPGPAALAFERLRVQAGAPPADPDRWALIVHCLALARGRHDPRQATGTMLRGIGLTEQRLDMLLSADLEVLFDLLPRLARRLNAAGAALDWLPLAEIVLNAGRREDDADKSRLRIARAYARAADKPDA